DVRDLLPPVTYQPAGPAGPGGQAGGGYADGVAGHGDGIGVDAGGSADGASYHGGPDREGGLAAGAAPPGFDDQGPSRTVGPISAWSPLVIATVAMVVAVSVMAPIIGTAIALAVLVALRAVSTTRRQLAKRQTGDGHNPGVP